MIVEKKSFYENKSLINKDNFKLLVKYFFKFTILNSSGTYRSNFTLGPKQECIYTYMVKEMTFMVNFMKKEAD